MKNMSRLNAIVVGGGVMGLSAARALLKAGHKVTVLEQGTVPNPLGSSVDNHRLIRFPYGVQDGYVRMVGEAYGSWQTLWQDLGEQLYVETGTLAFDAGGQSWAKESQASLSRCAIAHEILSPTQVASRFPMLDPSGLSEALYLSSGGVLMAERIVRALAAQVEKLGGALRPNTAVGSIDPVNGEVELAAGGSLAGDLVVVAAGPWAARLCRRLRTRVTPSRQVVTYLMPPARYEDAWAKAPMVLAIDPENGFYAVPPVAGLGLKVGDHRFTLSGDPDLERDALADEAAAIAGLCRGRFRDFEDYRIASAKTCFYDVEPSELFILEPLDAKGWIMSGFSGHGFKFGPLLGERLTAAIEGRFAPIALATWAAGCDVGGTPISA